MPMGDGIRRNVATISQEERNRLRDAFIDLHNRFYPGTKNDIRLAMLAIGSNRMNFLSQAK
jgi:hypothetical protein